MPRFGEVTAWSQALKWLVVEGQEVEGAMLLHVERST